MNSSTSIERDFWGWTVDLTPLAGTAPEFFTAVLKAPHTQDGRPQLALPPWLVEVVLCFAHYGTLPVPNPYRNADTFNTLRAYANKIGWHNLRHKVEAHECWLPSHQAQARPASLPMAGRATDGLAVPRPLAGPTHGKPPAALHGRRPVASTCPPRAAATTTASPQALLSANTCGLRAAGGLPPRPPPRALPTSVPLGEPLPAGQAARPLSLPSSVLTAAQPTGLAAPDLGFTAPPGCATPKTLIFDAHFLQEGVEKKRRQGDLSGAALLQEAIDRATQSHPPPHAASQSAVAMWPVATLAASQSPAAMWPAATLAALQSAAAMWPAATLAASPSAVAMWPAATLTAGSTSSATLPMVVAPDAIGKVGDFVSSAPSLGLLAQSTMNTPPPLALPFTSPSDPAPSAAHPQHGLGVGASPEWGHAGDAPTCTPAHAWSAATDAAPASLHAASVSPAASLLGPLPDFSDCFATDEFFDGLFDKDGALAAGPALTPPHKRARRTPG